MFCAKLEINENTTKEELDQAEDCLGCVEKMLKDLFEWQEEWERNGIDYSEIDSSAKSDIHIIGEKLWLKMRREKLNKFDKERINAVKKIADAKEKLKHKR